MAVQQLLLQFALLQLLQIADAVGLVVRQQLVHLPGHDSLLNVVQEPIKAEKFEGFKFLFGTSVNVLKIVNIVTIHTKIAYLAVSLCS